MKAIEQRIAQDEASAQDRYRVLFRGFEQYDLQQYIPDLRLQFSEALHDLIACLRCDGNTCNTICGGRSYYALHKGDTEFRHGRPAFRIFECPGVAMRKEELRRLYVAEADPPGRSAKEAQP